jgi:hypothetical protein
MDCARISLRQAFARGRWPRATLAFAAFAVHVERCHGGEWF